MSRNVIEWSSFVETGSEAAYLMDALKSGWVSGGSYVDRFERELERVYQGGEAYAVSNGTAALQLAFQVVGIKPGDKVIVPNFCFQAASNVLQQLGAIPVFSEVDCLTWNQTVETVSQVNTNGVVGIVVVHNYGRAAPVDQIVAWARDRGIWVVEDCAEAWFTKLRGRYVGQFGDIATFSMHATKTISSGEGGVVLLNRRDLSEKVALLRSHGLDRRKTHYQHALAGNNYRLSNLLAAVAFAQLESREKVITHQVKRNLLFLEGLSDQLGIDFQQEIASSQDLLWAVAIRLNTALIGLTRDEVMMQLKQRGIETRPGFYPASTLGYNKEFFNKTKMVISESIAREIIVLPCSASLSPSDIDRICIEFKDVIQAKRSKDRHIEVLNLRTVDDVEEKIELFRRKIRLGERTFRYFSKRNAAVVRQHDVSLLVTVGGVPTAYGHVETEAGRSWLGIAVADGEHGRGYGKLVLALLLSRSAKMGIHRISLRVDAENVRAVRLYERFGFLVESKESTTGTIMMTRIL